MEIKRIVCYFFVLFNWTMFCFIHYNIYSKSCKIFFFFLFRPGWLWRSTPLQIRGRAGEMVRRWHRKLGHKMCASSSSRNLCKRSALHFVDRGANYSVCRKTIPVNNLRAEYLESHFWVILIRWSLNSLKKGFWWTLMKMSWPEWKPLMLVLVEWVLSTRGTSWSVMIVFLVNGGFQRL